MFDSILETRKLSIEYNDEVILHDVDLGILPGNITALIGPSGCGKSSFLRLFNRMNDLREGFFLEGSVLYKGKDIYKENIDVRQLRREVGFIFEKPALLPGSVFDNVAFGLKMLNHAPDFIEEKVKQSLLLVSLEEELKEDYNKKASELNPRQQQLLCIARAMALDPAVLLMDMPTYFLDPHSESLVEQIILKLKSKTTIVFTTQNSYQAARLSDYSAFFCNGELIEQNRTEELFTNPRHGLTHKYLTGRFFEL